MASSFCSVTMQDNHLRAFHGAPSRWEMPLPPASAPWPVKIALLPWFLQQARKVHINQPLLLVWHAQLYVAAHFSQPNAVVFAPALEWRRLEAAVRRAKAELRAAHAAQLQQLMRAYLQVGAFPAYIACKVISAGSVHRAYIVKMMSLHGIPHATSLVCGMQSI